jgi:hypothetical protein
MVVALPSYMLKVPIRGNLYKITRTLMLNLWAMSLGFIPRFINMYMVLNGSANLVRVYVLPAQLG